MTTTTLYYGDLRSGRITDSLAATGASWRQPLNAAGAIDNVRVPGSEVRAKRLRRECMAARSFLALDVDGVLQEAGPVWSRTWDAEAGQLTLGAAGLWSLWDHRMVLPVLTAGQRVQTAVTTLSNTTLGGIARGLVAQALTHTGGAVPVVLPAAEAGTRTETFYGWQLAGLGDQLRQLTKRQVAAPDLRFRPRWTTDRLGVEWVMEVGTESAPLLTQSGADWYLDASVAQPSVTQLTTDEDATQMGVRGWVTGNGMEADILIGTAYAPALVTAGWPLLEVEENRSTVTEQATLDGYAQALVARSARPVEVWTAEVVSDLGRDILAGDYCRVTPHPADPWLGSDTGRWRPGEGEAYMRVQTKSGGLGGRMRLAMYSVAGQVS